MIEVKNIVKKYDIGTQAELTVLKGISFKISKGEYIILSGKSGAGKSTLMYQLSLLSSPTEGEILFNDEPVSTYLESKRSDYRLKNFGFIFQSYALNKDLTALENVALPLLCLGRKHEEAYKKSEKILTDLGLGERLRYYPEQLSGGEQQRVSIARAVAKEPDVLFADEPTASLDVANSNQVMDILGDLHKKGMTIVTITHEEQYKDRGTRLIELSDGEIIKDKPIAKK